jgi:hypothetical protein
MLYLYIIINLVQNSMLGNKDASHGSCFQLWWKHSNSPRERFIQSLHWSQLVTNAQICLFRHRCNVNNFIPVQFLKQFLCVDSKYSKLNYNWNRHVVVIAVIIRTEMEYRGLCVEPFLLKLFTLNKN